MLGEQAALEGSLMHRHGRVRPPLAAILLLCASFACNAAESRRANAKADAWLGKDASELLMQLRVDGGRVQINENDATNETSYTWSTWNPAWNEEVVTGVDQQMIGLSTVGVKRVCLSAT